MVGKRAEDVKVVITGVGAAGVAVTRILAAAGVRRASSAATGTAPSTGAGRGLTGVKAEYAEATNPNGLQGTADEVLAGADVYMGLSAPGAVSAGRDRTMASGAIVFAMANPTPEVMPEEIRRVAAVIATGRSDYPNQINNVLAFPGVFRGALDVRAIASHRGDEAGCGDQAIAAVVKDDELGPEYIVPSVFNRDVVPAVARGRAGGRGRRRRSAAPHDRVRVGGTSPASPPAGITQEAGPSRRSGRSRYMIAIPARKPPIA